MKLFRKGFISILLLVVVISGLSMVNAQSATETEQVVEETIRFEVKTQESSKTQIEAGVEEFDIKKLEEEMQVTAGELIEIVKSLGEIDIKVMHANEDRESMAKQFVEPKGILEEVDGQKYLKLTLKRTDWMKDIKVNVNGSVVEHDSEVTKTHEAVNEQGLYQTDSYIRFPIADLQAEISLGMVSIPMGNQQVSFRIVMMPESLIQGGINQNISIQIMHATEERASMSAPFFNDKAIYEQINGKQFITVYFKRSDWMKDINLKIGDQLVDHTNTVSKTYEELNEIGELQTDSKIRFEIKSLDEEINVNMIVIPMGNANVNLRIRLDKNTITDLDEGAVYDGKLAFVIPGETRISSVEVSEQSNEVVRNKLGVTKLPQTGATLDGDILLLLSMLLVTLGLVLNCYLRVKKENI